MFLNLIIFLFKNKISYFIFISLILFYYVNSLLLLKSILLKSCFYDDNKEQILFKLIKNNIFISINNFLIKLVFIIFDNIYENFFSNIILIMMLNKNSSLAFFLEQKSAILHFYKNLLLFPSFLRNFVLILYKSNLNIFLISNFTLLLFSIFLYFFIKKRFQINIINRKIEIKRQNFILNSLKNYDYIKIYNIEDFIVNELNKRERRAFYYYFISEFFRFIIRNIFIIIKIFTILMGISKSKEKKNYNISISYNSIISLIQELNKLRNCLSLIFEYYFNISKDLFLNENKLKFLLNFNIDDELKEKKIFYKYYSLILTENLIKNKLNLNIYKKKCNKIFFEDYEKYKSLLDDLFLIPKAFLKNISYHNEDVLIFNKSILFNLEYSNDKIKLKNLKKKIFTNYF